MSVSTNDKAIRLKHIGTAFTSFITNVLAPISEQVSGNTSDIESLEARVSLLESSAITISPNDTNESMVIGNISVDDEEESIVGS